MQVGWTWAKLGLAKNAPGRGHVAVTGVSREVVNVAVAAGTQEHRIGGVALELPVDQVADDDAAGLAVDVDQIEHLATGKELHRTGIDLPHQRRIGTEQELLAGLTAGVEGSRDLRTAEGAVVEHATVLAREGHALGDTLVDDIDADLGQAMDVALAGAVVAALDGVVEEPVDRIAVVLVVLRRVDPALGGDAVRAARRIEDGEREYVVAHLAEAGGRRSSGQSGTHHDDGVLAPVRRVHQQHVPLVMRPFGLDRTGGNLAVENHWVPPPRKMTIGMTMKPPARTTANTLPTRRRTFECPAPSDSKALPKPCQAW